MKILMNILLYSCFLTIFYTFPSSFPLIFNARVQKAMDFMDWNVFNKCN